MASPASRHGGFAMHPFASASSRRLHTALTTPSRSPSPPRTRAPAPAAVASQSVAQRTSLLSMSTGPVKSGKSKILLQHFRDFRTTRFFECLTAITLVMFIINMVQIALIDHLNSLTWILGFPAVVFGFMLLALLIWMIVSRRAFLESWHDAEWSTRIARIGIVLSVFLPVFCCEFLYLNLVAVPAYHRKGWDTSLQSYTEVLAPSFMLAQPLANIILDVSESCSDPPLGNGNSGTKFGCLGPMQTLPTHVEGGYQYRLFDGAKTPVNISTTSKLAIAFGITFDETLPTEGGLNENLLFAFFDPRLTSDLAQAVDCAIVRFDIYPINQSTTVEFFLEQSGIVDNVGALKLPDLDDQSCNLASFAKYNTYSYRSYELDVAPETQFCTKPAPEAPCTFETVIYMESMLVNTQTSTRGTSWIKMILDEGSIVGGITFVTWFLGIYII